MKAGLITTVAFLVCVLCTTDQALAWGPATHIGFGRVVLDNLTWLPAALAAILGRNRLAYLYGNIAADVVFAKRWSRIKQTCHHWSTAFALLDSARDDRSRAFAYGYLSHLAADTIAHGKYVPRQITLSGSTVNFGHLYWELRADATERESNWHELRQVLGEDHSHHHDTLAGHITGTFLPYDLNRQLFENMNALAARRAFRRTMKVWSRYSCWYLPPALLSGYRAECVDRIQSILRDGQRSALLREDPNGTSALMRLRVQRREYRRLRRHGIPVDCRLIEASRTLAPCVKSDPPTTRADPVAVLASAK